MSQDSDVTQQNLARARAGDEDAFRELTNPYRRELQVHVYRMVGSAQDAEDLLQETLLAAWRGLEQFEGRASVRSWLYRIATNRSLDALRATRRRPEDPRMPQMPEPTRWSEPVWLEPYPDVLLRRHPGRRSRAGRAVRGQGGDRAGVHRRPATSAAGATCGADAARRARLPRPRRSPRCSTPATPAVNSLLRRARAAFESRLPAAGRERAPLPDSKLERDIVGRFAEAVEDGDVDGMVALLTDDAWLTMPPLPHAYQGRDAIGAFLGGAEQRRGAPLRVVATHANGQPAFGCYLSAPETGVARAFSLLVLTLAGRPHRGHHLVRGERRVQAVRPAADLP